VPLLVVEQEAVLHRGSSTQSTGTRSDRSIRGVAASLAPPGATPGDALRTYCALV
jgi:hypothetical protein